MVRIARQTGGLVEAVTETEIVEAMRLLAKTEGILVETAAGVTLGAVINLARAGRWGRNDLVVAYLTGHGYKTLESMAGGDGSMDQINPTLDALEKVVDSLS